MTTETIGFTPSSKSYGAAVCLCAIFGLLGIHHFYLGRILHGIIDLSMTIGAIALIFTGQVQLYEGSGTGGGLLMAGYGLLMAGYGLLIIDAIHTFTITILLLIGKYRDGRGFVVAYPGQRQ